MPITLAQAEEARKNIAAVAVRTPLVLCNTDAPAHLYLKLKNLQLIGLFKIRWRGERDGTDAARAA
jgi:threonine dehydratase